MTHFIFLTHATHVKILWTHATHAKISTHLTHDAHAKILWTHATHATHVKLWHPPLTHPHDPRNPRNLADPVSRNVNDICEWWIVSLCGTYWISSAYFILLRAFRFFLFLSLFLFFCGFYYLLRYWCKFVNTSNKVLELFLDS